MGVCPQTINKAPPPATAAARVDWRKTHGACIGTPGLGVRHAKLGWRGVEDDGLASI